MKCEGSRAESQADGSCCKLEWFWYFVALAVLGQLAVGDSRLAPAQLWQRAVARRYLAGDGQHYSWGAWERKLLGQHALGDGVGEVAAFEG